MPVPTTAQELEMRLASLWAAVDVVVFVEDIPMLANLASDLLLEAVRSGGPASQAAIAQATRIQEQLRWAVRVVMAIESLEAETGLDDAEARCARLAELQGAVHLARFTSVYGARAEVLRADLADALEARAAIDRLGSAALAASEALDLRLLLRQARTALERLTVGNPWRACLEQRLLRYDASGRP